MSTIQTMDVTLRDGGYKTNFHFKHEELKTILAALDRSGIEYIEVGYKNGSLHPIANIGNAGLCKKEYLIRCRNLISKAKLAVMIHSKNIKDNDLEEMLDCGVNTLRICLLKNGYKDNRDLIDKAKKMGYEVSVNITRITHYTEEELDDLISMLNLHDIDIIYLADSNGSLFPSRVKSIFERYTKQYSVPFGFHAHDNLGLAQANTIAAQNGGVRYIDATLSGLGKGVGNLKTELLVSYLHAINITKYNIQEILNASNFVRNTIAKGDANISMEELMMGVSDLSIDDIKKLKL